MLKPAFGPETPKDPLSDRNGNRRGKTLKSLLRPGFLRSVSNRLKRLGQGRRTQTLGPTPETGHVGDKLGPDRRPPVPPTLVSLREFLDSLHLPEPKQRDTRQGRPGVSTFPVWGPKTRPRVETLSKSRIFLPSLESLFLLVRPSCTSTTVSGPLCTRSPRLPGAPHPPTVVG